MDSGSRIAFPVSVRFPAQRRCALKLGLALFCLSVMADAWSFEHTEGFESGLIDPQWWKRDIEGPCEIKVVNNPSRLGNHAVRFMAGEGARCEIVHWPRHRLFQWFRREPYGEHRWYAFSVFLPADRKLVHTHQNEIVAQWHASYDPWFFEPSVRGPPLALRIQGEQWVISHGSDGKLRSDPGIKGNRILWTGELALGVWTDWVFHVVWSPDENGLLEVWQNGVAIASHHGPIAYNDLRGVYLKLGSYHPRSDQTTYLDEVRVGGDRSIAGPLLQADDAPRQTR